MLFCSLLSTFTDVSWMPYCRCILGVSHRDKALWMTQKTLEGQLLLACLGLPKGSSGRTGGSFCGEGGLSISTETLIQLWVEWEKIDRCCCRNLIWNNEDIRSKFLCVCIFSFWCVRLLVLIYNLEFFHLIIGIKVLETIKRLTVVRWSCSYSCVYTLYFLC